MKDVKILAAWVSFCVVVGLLAGPANAVNIATVPVGNPGNAGELSGAGAGGTGPNRICGAVGYTYNIGKYEVTAGQYTEFLNAVAKTDQYGLYNTDMWSSAVACRIQRSGSSGSFAYSVASDWANRPVNYVCWGDSARFANWLSNGQPTTGVENASTTENGSYALNGATSTSALMAVTRKTNAKYVIPTEDEWYKAAYYDPNKPGGAGYWDYPTRSNTIPSNVLSSTGTNNANWVYTSYTIGSPYWRTVVGEFENSLGPYGTFDQGGNVWEWTEAVVVPGERGARGGSFDSWYDKLHASCRMSGDPTYEGDGWVGIRLVEVPEPATLSLLALAGAGLLARRRRGVHPSFPSQEM